MNTVAIKMKRAAGLFQSGDFQASEKDCRALLAHNPDLFDARHLLALNLLQLGQGEAAIEALEQADRKRPGNGQLRANLVLALTGIGRIEQACKVLLQLLEQEPHNPDFLYQMASLRNRLGQQSQAEQYLLELHRLHPDHLAANALLAQLLEQRQDDKQALKHAEFALGSDPGHFVAGLSRARVLLRQGRETEALADLNRLLQSSDSRVNRSLVLTTLGKIQDHAGQFEQAFASFKAANTELSLSATAKEVRDTSVYSLAALREMDSFFDDQRLHRWPALSAATDDGSRTPTFLIGFPRSGTTLLDRMLDAHPGIAVLEEQPTLHAALSKFVQGGDSLQALELLDASKASDLRSNYWQRVGTGLDANPGNDLVVIDKLPLNLVFVGLIYRIFPTARFIFSIRDPRDVCLSCFMQSFGLNDAMSHFLQLATTAHYYASAMALGLRQLDALPVAQHHIRYEDLVENPEQQVRAVLEFLQLPWNSSVLNYHELVPGQRIDTPSYEQVAKPLYRSSINRWQNYHVPMQEILGELQPFTERFGYTSS